MKNEIKQTMNYDMFVFRADNRAKIEESNINRIVRSIRERNMLHLRPIQINEKFEIIDGQNRLLAAKRLNVPIYYVMEDTLDAKEIILLNTQKGWQLIDYFNFYIHHQYPEYLKLKKFMEINRLQLKIALEITMGSCKLGRESFKTGDYKFNTETFYENFDAAWSIINFIRKTASAPTYWTTSGRFWKSLLQLVNHRNFDLENFLKNATKAPDRFGPRATIADYLKMFMGIANSSRRSLQINLLENEE